MLIKKIYSDFEEYGLKKFFFEEYNNSYSTCKLLYNKFELNFNFGTFVVYTDKSLSLIIIAPFNSNSSSIFYHDRDLFCHPLCRNQIYVYRHCHGNGVMNNVHEIVNEYEIDASSEN
jgi:hypothetical protein